MSGPKNTAQNNKTISVGIIGCGYWGPNFVRNFSRINGAGVCGVYDRAEAPLEQIKKLYPKITVYRRLENLLDDADAVVISTPASTHFSLALQALKNGRHVLVEKPLTTSSVEARVLAGVAKKVNRVLMVGHTFLYNPAVIKIKQIVDSGDLGRLYYIHARRTNLGPLRKDVNALWDLAPHDISVVNYLLGRMPLTVCAHAQKFLSHRFEDVGFIIMRYPSNVLAHLHVSWLDPKKIREMTFIGSDKMLVYDDTCTGQPIRIYDKKVMKKRYERAYRSFEEFQLIIRQGRDIIPQVRSDEPLKKECRHFIDCIRGGAKPLTDVLAGRDVVRVLEALSSSLNSANKTVRVGK